MEPNKLQLNDTLEGLVLKRRSMLDTGEDTSLIDSAIQQIAGEISGKANEDEKSDTLLITVLSEIKDRIEKGLKIEGISAVKGDQGEKGEQGEPGHNYVLTAQDINDISETVVRKIPKGLALFKAEELRSLIEDIARLVPPGAKGDTGEKGDKGEKGDTAQVNYEILRAYCSDAIKTAEEGLAKKELNVDQLIAVIEKIPVEKGLTWDQLKDKPNINELVARAVGRHKGGNGKVSSKSYAVAELEDVAATSPTNGQALVYNSSSKKWIAQTINSLAIGASITGGTAYRVLYIDSTGKLAQNDNFTYNAALAGTSYTLSGDNPTITIYHTGSSGANGIETIAFGDNDVGLTSYIRSDNLINNTFDIQSNLPINLIYGVDAKLAISNNIVAYAPITVQNAGGDAFVTYGITNIGGYDYPSIVPFDQSGSNTMVMFGGIYLQSNGFGNVGLNFYSNDFLISSSIVMDDVSGQLIYNGNTTHQFNGEILAANGMTVYGHGLNTFSTTQKIGLNTASPSAMIDVNVGGSTSAGSAPLKLKAGSGVMTTPESGAIEHFNQLMYYTNSQAERIRITGVKSLTTLVNQTAAKAATTFYTTTIGGTGLYRISYESSIKTAAAGGGTPGSTLGAFQMTFTHPNDWLVKTTVAGGTSTANTTGTTISGSYIVYAKQGTNMQYTFGYVSSGTTPMAYDLEITVEQLT